MYQFNLYSMVLIQEFMYQSYLKDYLDVPDTKVPNVAVGSYMCW